MKYSELKIGMTFQEKHYIETSDVIEFAEVSKDKNPIHLDKEFAKGTIFKKPIVHGMLIGSFFSKCIATDLPGAGSIYINQEMKFLKPIYHNSEVTIRISILELKDPKQVVILKTECFIEDVLVVDGKAVVKCLN